MFIVKKLNTDSPKKCFLLNHAKTYYYLEITTVNIFFVNQSICIYSQASLHKWNVFIHTLSSFDNMCVDIHLSQ